MTLYALRTGAEPGEDHVRAPGIEPMEHAGSYLSDAVALWWLADERRAAALHEFLDEGEQADPDGHPRWDTGQVWYLVDLLTGLEEALQSTGVMAEDWTTPMDQVIGLARRVPSMDVRPERTDAELRQALAEIVVGVVGLRTYLTQVATAGLDLELA